MRILITGSTGFIGERIVRAVAALGQVPIETRRAPGPHAHPRLDLAQPHEIPAILDALAPDAIIHSGAMRDLADCERNPDLAVAVNVESTRGIARWCAARSARLVYLSTDQVFDGRRGMYREGDARRPINHYGATKALGEDCVLALGTKATVARIALTLGHTRERTRSPNEFVVSSLRAGKPATLFENEFRTPVLVDDAASALAELALREGPRIIHLGGPERLSRVEMGLGIARAFGLDQSLCVATRHDPRVGLVRPLDTSMDTSLARQILRVPPRAFDDSLRALVETEPRA
jgi:dTDP-4-dehydrorhamnose reductase